MEEKNNIIIKQTGIVGAVQVVRLSFGLIRNKLVALFFGTEGIGIWAILHSFTEMMQQAAFMGMDKAGVKKISENSNNEAQQVLAIKVIKFSFFVNSIIIAFCIMCFSGFLDETAFSQMSSGASLLVALYLLLNCNSLCISSVLNGLREIRKYALSQLSAVLVGNLAIFAVLPFVSLDQLPHCFLLQGLANLIFSAYFFAKLNLNRYSFRLKEYFGCYKNILKVGIGFWLPAMYMALVEYLIRGYLTNELSIKEVGIYQACWTISNMYIGIILSSMGVALYPKLCQIQNNKNETVKLINEQIEFSLILSIGIVVLLIGYSSFFLTLLYSADFGEGSEIIKWQLCGVIMRLLGFPFGYALMAAGYVKYFVISQFIFTSSLLVLMILFVEIFGFEGIGINYLFSYSIYLMCMYIICTRKINFKFNSHVFKIMLFCVIVISLEVLFYLYANPTNKNYLSFINISFSFVFSYYLLVKKFNFNILESIQKKIKGLK